MFLRKKKNPSGVVSVQVIDKSGGKYRVLKTIGSSSDLSEVEMLYQQGKNWIASCCGARDMFSEQDLRHEEKQVTEHLLSNIENILLNGTQLILNQVFRLTGFESMDDEILKHLVIARICHPRSKVATVDYLKFYFDEDIELYKIYRYLDKLHNSRQEEIQRISVEHTRKILGGKIGLVFYDVTTLYFGVNRLQKAYKSGSITKESFNKRGYNKFLEISNNVSVSINRDKIIEDEKWDGLKGYLTNTSLSAQDVYEQYSELWHVERAFRITKGTLELHPMFHFSPKRIEAHVCICFVAYKIYREMERILKLKNINMSVDKVMDIAKTITTVKIRLPLSNQTLNKTMILTPKHRSIDMLFDENFWKNL